MDVALMIGGIIIGIAMSTPMLILAWLLILILQYSWSGMSKFLSIILFPGIILHSASHFLFGKLFRIRVFEVLRINMISEKSNSGLILSSDIYRKEPHKVYLTLLSPLIISLVFIITLRKLLIYIIPINIKIAIILAWLIISIATYGMPSQHDIQFLFMYHIIKHPETIIALLWSIIVWVLGYLAYNASTATTGTLIYIVLVLLASFIPRQESLLVIE